MSLAITSIIVSLLSYLAVCAAPIRFRWFFLILIAFSASGISHFMMFAIEPDLVVSENVILMIITLICSLTIMISELLFRSIKKA